MVAGSIPASTPPVLPPSGHPPFGRMGHISGGTSPVIPRRSVSPCSAPDRSPDGMSSSVGPSSPKADGGLPSLLSSWRSGGGAAGAAACVPAPPGCSPTPGSRPAVVVPSGSRRVAPAAPGVLRVSVGALPGAGRQGPVQVVPTRQLVVQGGAAHRDGRRVATPLGRAVDQDAEADALALLSLVGSVGGISRAEFVGAAVSQPAVLSLLGAEASDRGAAADEAHDAFDTLADGRRRVGLDDLVKYFARKRAGAPGAPGGVVELARPLFRFMDVDGLGAVSRWGFVDALRRSPTLSALLLPGEDGTAAMASDRVFDRAKAVFSAITQGSARLDYASFERYCRRFSVESTSLPALGLERLKKKMLVIGPGFDREAQAEHSRMLEDSGYQVHWCDALPRPDRRGFSATPYLPQLQEELESAAPDLVVSASVGGAYVVALWQSGLWAGPTLMLNAHPCCLRIPASVRAVIAHGSNDEVFPTARKRLEDLVATGSPNRCLLYYTGDSGRLSSGRLSRIGDRHDLASLLRHDCLPRLADAALSEDCPELALARSWRLQLSAARSEAEEWLGLVPARLRRRWRPAPAAGALVDVPEGGEEFQAVARVFKATPKDPLAYVSAHPRAWEACCVTRVRRVENASQEECSAGPYFFALQRSLEAQGLAFEPGTHTCWAFHGASAEAVESVVLDPAGFQPCMAGSRGASPWGPGTYFARDARYVAEGGFCGLAADGSKQMLMCLVAIGVPCLGDPKHNGVLPFRQKPHRYNSSVDSLADPEIYVLQHAGASLPAYLVSFR